MVGERFDVEADRLLAGEGVEIAADRVHLAGDVLRRAGARTFEEHVLDEVRDAVGLRGLAARAGFDPDAHGDGAQMLHALGQNDQAVGQYSTAKIALRCHSHSVEFDCRPAGRTTARSPPVWDAWRLTAFAGETARSLHREVEMLYAEPSRDRELSNCFPLDAKNAWACGSLASFFGMNHSGV